MPRRAGGGETKSLDVLEYVRDLTVCEHASDRLVELLSERSPIYAGRRTDEVDQLRAIILRTFEGLGLPREAVPFVLEELESGGNPQTVAAAARALRNAGDVPPQAVDLLLRALDRFATADDVLEANHPAGTEPTTLLLELAQTLVRLAPQAASGCRETLRSLVNRNAQVFSDEVRAALDSALTAMSPEQPIPACCRGLKAAPAGSDPVVVASSPLPSEVVLQDQDGELTTFASFLVGRPSVVAFFYTRCMVPEKCSLTITKLARLQRKLATESLTGRVNVAAITYDPAFDLPSRMRAYGLDRGVAFDRQNRLLRAPHGIEPLRRYFDLQVGFGPATVNRHRLELYVLDRMAKIAASFTRMQWDEQKIFATLQRL
jgi:cytochrome oxidase Cu insertion factor (SCO1/SenC/PrrC family)